AMTSGAALNAMVSPWFERRRPAALSMAFNGASLGGVVFSPLWVALIAAMGFGPAVMAVAAAMLVVIGGLAWGMLRRTPAALGVAAAHPGAGRVAGAVRAGWIGGASVLDAGAGAGQRAGRGGHGPGYRLRHWRPPGAGAGDVAADGPPQGRGVQPGLAGAGFRGIAGRGHVGRRHGAGVLPVRHGSGQCDFAAAL